jgi:hypothetical protein
MARIKKENLQKEESSAKKIITVFAAIIHATGLKWPQKPIALTRIAVGIVAT